MADERTRRRRRNRRRKVAVLGVAAVVVTAGAGTAWAMSGQGGPSYRLAKVARADIAQTVDADGTLTSQDTATQSFAASGTVASVLVKTGEEVVAGQVLATLDRSSLKADVTSAKTTLANAKQTLADNEAGETSTTSTSTTSTATSSDSSSSNVTTDAATTRTGRIVLVADETSRRDTSSAVSKAGAEVKAAQRAVVTAQSTLDGYVADLTTACTTSSNTETTQQTTAGSDGSVSGTADSASVVTIADDSTTSDNPQTVATGGTWTFSGLTASQTYRVVIVPVVDDTACTSAISAVSAAEGSTSDTSTDTLFGAVSSLNDAISDFETATASAAGSSGVSTGGTGSGSTGTSGAGGSGTSGTGGSGSTGGTRSGSAPSGSGSSTSGSGSASTTGSGSVPATGTGSSGSSTPGGSSTTATITAAQIAADQKSIDAAKAALAVAGNDMNLATLTTPISGTVASVEISTGSSVAASSSSDTIVITTDRALSVPVDISLADINLIKIGETGSVTVDGRSEALAAKVSMIGLANTSSSTGSSSTYEVTLVLDERYAKLFDGMGASVAIDVGTARHAICVPVSAVSTSGTTTTVGVYSAGTTTATRVTLGVEGNAVVQVKDGLTVGDEVVLANLDEALPSSDSSSTSGSSLTGGSGGFGGSGSFSGGSRPGGGSGGPP